MATDVLPRMYTEQARSIRTVLDSADSEGLTGPDLSRIANAVLAFTRTVLDHVDGAETAILTDDDISVGQASQVRDGVETLLMQLLKVLDGLLGLAERTSALLTIESGFQSPMRDVATATDAVRLALERVRHDWPTAHADPLVQAEIASGDGADLEDAIAGAMGVSRDEFLRRVTERKASNSRQLGEE